MDKKTIRVRRNGASFQRPCGVILSMTRFRIRDPGEILFSVVLFIWQLAFLVWTYVFDGIRRGFVVAVAVENILIWVFCGWEWFLPLLWLTMCAAYTLIPGRVPLRLVVKSAAVTHVRLCLEKVAETNRWRYVSQSAPDAKTDEWSDDQLLGRRFVHMSPRFARTVEFVAAAIKYANDHVADRGKRGYDYLQLGSILLNSILFWWIPSLRGREVVKLLNAPGFREICSTLVTAILRWAAWWDEFYSVITKFPSRSSLFREFDTSMVSPCLFPIEAYLRGTWVLPERWQVKPLTESKGTR